MPTDVEITTQRFTPDDMDVIYNGLEELISNVGDKYTLSVMEWEVLRMAKSIIHILYMCEKYPDYHEKLKTGGMQDKPETTP